MEKIRLSKALAASGVASRRASEELIFAGKVEVNGVVERVPQTMVNPSEDEFRVDGAVVKRAESKIIYILNKPKNVVCSSQPVGTKKLVVDLFKEDRRRLFTVGRLDRDTTGLLLVTNDGHFSNRVIHPSANIVKEYLVKVDREVKESDMIIMRQGVWIDGKKVKPVRVRKVRKGTFKVAVKEGKNREVRRLAEKAGLHVVELMRIRIGGLVLGNLREGEFRALSEKEKLAIFS